MKEGIGDHNMKHSIGCAPRRGIGKVYRTEKGRRVPRKIAINLMPVVLSMLILIAAMIPLSQAEQQQIVEIWNMT